MSWNKTSGQKRENIDYLYLLHTNCCQNVISGNMCMGFSSNGNQAALSNFSLLPLLLLWFPSSNKAPPCGSDFDRFRARLSFMLFMTRPFSKTSDTWKLCSGCGGEIGSTGANPVKWSKGRLTRIDTLKRMEVSNHTPGETSTSISLNPSK